MTRQAINPSDMYNSVEYGFSHAVQYDAGARVIELAGQVAWDQNREIVGPGDLAAQTAQVLTNLKSVLATAGATPADIVRIRTYVVDHTPDKLAIVGPELGAFYGDALPARVWVWSEESGTWSWGSPTDDDGRITVTSSEEGFRAVARPLYRGTPDTTAWHEERGPEALRLVRTDD